ncbi:MAG: membrane or secreted protein [Bacteroidetes bacterium]|nr:MAG: membrane or secreted protein [Bacteroidota bacterium]
MQSIILTVGLLGIGFALFAIRLFFVKDSDVRGGCAGKNPLLAEEGVTCTVCGRVPEKEGCAEEG